MISNNNTDNINLLYNEHIIWTEQPNPWQIFRKSDLFMIPFSFFFFAISLTLFIPNFNLRFFNVTFKTVGNGLTMRSLFAIPFVLVGFWVSIGQLLARINRLRNTQYYVTNKRVFIYSKALFKEMNTKANNYNGNSTIFSSKRSVMSTEDMITQARDFDEIGYIKVYKKMFGGWNLVFCRSVFPSKYSFRNQVEFENINNAKFLRDIILEQKTLAKQKRHEVEYAAPSVL